MKTFSLILLLFTSILGAQVPPLLHHQGRIAVNGINYSGNGSFKFLLYHGPSPGTITTPLWKNDDSSPTDGSEPSSSVTIGVTNGLYSLNLGESPQQAFPTDITPTSPDNLYLRIWFSDNVNGFQALSPDQKLTTVPFAFSAQTVPEQSITEDRLAFTLPPAYATNPLVLAGKTNTNMITNNVYGGFIEFPKNFPAPPISLVGIDETLDQLGALLIHLENDRYHSNEVAFRTDVTCDRIHWFAMEPGIHTISGKTVIAGKTSLTSSSETVTFPQPFSSPPVVLFASANNSLAWYRLNAPTTNNDFSVRVNTNNSECYWIAMEPGEYQHGRFKWHAGSEAIASGTQPIINFPAGFNTTEQAPSLIATILDTNGNGATVTRLHNITPQSATLYLNSSTEFVNYLIFLEEK